jgi:hypothetical protein
MEDKNNKLPVYYFKKDRYRRARGGKTKLIDVYCSFCHNLLLIYQKDLPRGLLKRCYLDRIFYPHRFASLQHDKPPDAMGIPKLECESCRSIIGTPMRYTKHGENRLAYNMIQGKFIKKSSTHGIGREK